MQFKTMLPLLLATSLGACVQKAHEKTVVVTLTVPGGKNSETAGLRGGDKPLSWDSDLPLTEILADSVYTAVFTTKTAYKFTEVKFRVNDTWELAERPNRRIYFSEKADTTYYHATFNVE